MIRQAWQTDYIGSPMHQVAHKIKKKCQLALLQWNRTGQHNSSVRIQQIKEQIEELREAEGNRDWKRWYSLKAQLDMAYKEEEVYWSQRTRVQWLQEGDKNTHFF